MALLSMLMSMDATIKPREHAQQSYHFMLDHVICVCCNMCNSGLWLFLRHCMLADADADADAGADADADPSKDIIAGTGCCMSCCQNSPKW